MGLSDFLEKIGVLVEENILGYKKFNENDRYIKAIYAALAGAEKDLRNWNETIYRDEIRSKKSQMRKTCQK